MRRLTTSFSIRESVVTDRAAPDIRHRLCVMGSPQDGFPLFPLGIVALPSESVPLHVFEERYKTMIERCLREHDEFGIVWLSEEELKPIGCACEIDRVLERMDDGQLTVLVRGTRVFRLLERQDDLPYPAGVVEFLDERDEPLDAETAQAAHTLYAELLEQATDRTLAEEELADMSAYDMAATVDFGADAKQELLELRSENARLRLLTLLFRAAIKQLELVESAQVRARSNGKVFLA
jgi:Lon protease-like protein